MAEPLTGWAITSIGHSMECTDCTELASGAANLAAEYNLPFYEVSADSAGHSIRVTRAYGMVFTGAASSDEIEFINEVSL